MRKTTRISLVLWMFGIGLTVFLVVLFMILMDGPIACPQGTVYVPTLNACLAGAPPVPHPWP